MFSIAESMAGSSVTELETVSSGRSSIDSLLGGGAPRGQLIEICGRSSSGKSSLAMALCMGVMEAGQTAAWIDVSGQLCPLAAVEAGLPVDRFLVVKLGTMRSVMRAARILLGSSGAVGMLVVEIPPGLKRSQLPRERELVGLQRLAERSGTAVVLVSERGADEPSLGAIVTMRLYAERIAEPTGNGPAAVRSMSGGRMRLGVLRNKRGPSGRSDEDVIDGPDRLRIRGSL